MFRTIRNVAYYIKDLLSNVTEEGYPVGYVPDEWYDDAVEDFRAEADAHLATIAELCVERDRAAEAEQHLNEVLDALGKQVEEQARTEREAAGAVQAERNAVVAYLRARNITNNAYNIECGRHRIEEQFPVVEYDRTGGDFL